MKIFILSIAVICVSCNLPTPKSKLENKNYNLEYNSDTCYFIYKKYIGKEIRLFTNSVDFGNYKRMVIIDSKPGKASSLLFEYDKNICIELIPKAFKHMKSFDKNFKWDIEKFKLEDILEIKVYRNDSLVKVVR